MKIAIIGYSGSGKSTLASLMGKRCHIPVLHLDTVQFSENWEVREAEEAKAIVSRFMQNESWVIDGNYAGYHQEERLEQADRIILLSFNRLRCLYRVSLRYRKYKNQTRPDMADGCPEKLDREFVWWILWKGRTRKRKQQFKQILSQYNGKVTVLKNQKQIDGFIARLQEQTGEPA